jgi:hypothetical protein
MGARTLLAAPETTRGRLRPLASRPPTGWRPEDDPTAGTPRSGQPAG